MNDTQRRRQQLLKQMRDTYDDRREIPAIHPRYRASYQQLYDEENVENHTFGIRVVLCILLFVAFTVLEQNHNTIMKFDSDRIANEIHREFDFGYFQKGYK